MTKFNKIKTGKTTFQELENAMYKNQSISDLVKLLYKLASLLKIDRFHQCTDKQGRNIIEIQKGCKLTIYTIETDKDYEFTLKELEGLCN